MSENSVKDLIKSTNFKFNKNLGQNFIFDNNLLDAIVVDSGVSNEDIVVEIGTGAGTLTKALSKVAKKVYSFEVDRNLQEILSLSLQGVDNVEVIFKDVLRMKDKDFEEIVKGPFKVVANLPYYITTSLVLRFLQSNLKCQGITVMVQKEVADRFVAKANTEEYSAITLAIQMKGSAKITRNVNKTMFFPAPNVDSAVVRIDFEENKLAGEDYKLIDKLTRSAFAMRRKTLANNLSTAFSISKQEAEKRIEEAGFDSKIRGEVLALEDFIKLSKQLK